MSLPHDQPPEPPQPLRTAVLLMWVGAGLYGWSVLLFPTQLDFLRESLEEQGFSDTGFDDAVLLAPLVGAVIVTLVISAGLWILMAVMNRRGKAWARITATVLAGINLPALAARLDAVLRRGVQALRTRAAGITGRAGAPGRRGRSAAHLGQERGRAVAGWPSRASASLRCGSRSSRSVWSGASSRTARTSGEQTQPRPR